jgi:acetyltransferase-like isoleucine patch superfamily enzyme
MKKVVLFFLKLFSPIFFKKEYLKGRWFDQTNMGWVWVLQGIWFQKCLRFNKDVPWPIHPTSKISKPENVKFHPDNIDNFQSPGCYYQNFAAQITIGHGTYIAPNVGIITANHDLNNLDTTGEAADVTIGSNCWLGMNAVILPGVTLGDKTVVGAGSIVTKSFTSGNCVIGGVPAKVIKEL